MEGYIFTGVCLLTGGGGTPRYLSPVKVPTHPPARSGQGVPQGTYPLDRTAYGVLDTPWSVCCYLNALGSGKALRLKRQLSGDGAISEQHVFSGSLQ